MQQIKSEISNWQQTTNHHQPDTQQKLLVTGGGAFNTFLIERLTKELASLSVDVVVPDNNLVQYKEALIMAFIGVLRWRQEYNVLSSVTGATRDSIGGGRKHKKESEFSSQKTGAKYMCNF